jgi:hypothetical protein
MKSDHSIVLEQNHIKQRVVQGRIFFDATFLRKRIKSANTLVGIHRTLCMIVSELLNEAHELEVYFAYLDEDAGGYRAVRLTESDSKFLTHHDGLRRVLGVNERTSRERLGLQKYRKGSVKYHYNYLRYHLHALAGDRNFFERRGVPIEKWKSSNHSNMQPSMHRITYDLDGISDEGDQLVLLDSIWNERDLLQRLVKIKARKIKIYSMIYDLIPVDQPEFVPEEMSREFLSWLNASLNYTGNV